MPHVIVKLWPGKSKQQKARLADAITKEVMDELDYGDLCGVSDGVRVFCRDNLAFRAELMVKRKHRVNGAAHFSSGKRTPGKVQSRTKKPEQICQTMLSSAA